MCVPDHWKRPLQIIKYLLGFVILAWVLSTIDWRSAVGTVAGFSMRSAIAIIVVAIVGAAVPVGAWQVLAARFTSVRFRNILVANLIVRFVNTLFPSRVSGRSVAPLALHRHVGLNWNDAVAVTMAHTALHAILYAMFTVAGAVLIVGQHNIGLLSLILFSVAAYLTVGLSLGLAGWRLDLLEHLFTGVRRIVLLLPQGSRLAGPLKNAQIALLDGTDEQFQELLRDRSRITLFIIIWIAGVIIIPAVRIWILLQAVGVTDVDPVLLPLYVVVAYSVTILPLTPGGIGVVEATAVVVFVTLGLPQSAIVTVVFLDRLLGVYLPSLIGWVPLINTNVVMTDTG